MDYLIAGAIAVVVIVLGCAVIGVAGYVVHAT